MSEKEMLKNLEKMLKGEQFECAIDPDIAAPPYGRVLVFLGQDLLERERILNITVQHQELLESVQEPKQHPRYYRLQFELQLPFSMKEYTAPQVASLLAFLNRTLELPGFELDEVHSKIYYRYVHLTQQIMDDGRLITSIIGVVLMLLELFSATIEQVAEGKSSFNDILEQMLQIAGNMEG